MFEQILVDQNPHWNEEYHFDGIRREKFDQLAKYLSVPHVIAITGVRRCGKSTLLKQLIDELINNQQTPNQNILFLNLEQPYLLQYTDDINQLENIFQTYLTLKLPKGQIYVLLDEVQFFRNWPVFIKSHYEKKKIKFIITGSNSSLLSSEMITLLSGRALSIELYPLSFREYMTTFNIEFQTKEKRLANRQVLNHHLLNYIKNGSFPEIFHLPDEQLSNDILNAYAKTIIFQDIAPRLNLRKPNELEKLFAYLITNIGSICSYNKLASHFALSDKAIKDYIYAFSEAYLLFELEKFSFSVKNQQRANKKIYAIDTGMTNACGFRFSENHGKLLENTIYLECKRRGYEIFYYKTDSNFEVDFIIKKDRTIQAIQVSWDINQPDTYQREIRALSSTMDELNIDSGTLVTLSELTKPKNQDSRIKLTPAYEWLLT